jgi:hypothetical protein
MHDHEWLQERAAVSKPMLVAFASVVRAVALLAGPGETLTLVGVGLADADDGSAGARAVGAILMTNLD